MRKSRYDFDLLGFLKIMVCLQAKTRRAKIGNNPGHGLIRASYTVRDIQMNTCSLLFPSYPDRSLNIKAFFTLVKPL